MDDEERLEQQESQEEQQELEEQQEQQSTQQAYAEVSEKTKQIEKKLAKNAMNSAKAKAEKALKDKMKKKAKKAAKAKVIGLFVKGLIAILPIFLQIILLIAIALSIVGIVNKVADLFSGIGQSIVDFFTNSSEGIQIKEEQVNDILKQLAEEGYELGERYVKKFLEAEATTVLPKTSDRGVQGTIEIRKTNSRDESGTEESTVGNLLTYTDYESFKNSPDGSHFSMDPSGNLVVATYTSNKETGGEQYTLMTISSYKSLVSQFRVPYTFLLDLYMVTENPEFVYKLAEEIEKSKVVLTLQDTETTIHREWEEEDDEGNTVTRESWERYNSLTPLITRADTIFYRKAMIYNNKVTVTVSGGDNETITTTTNSYSQGPDQAPYFKNVEFKNILKTRYHANENPLSTIIGAPYNSVVNVNASLLINLFNENVDNEVLIQQFRYMLYLMTGNDFGVTELDIDFSWVAFNPGSSLVGGTVAEKVWCALKELGYSDIAAAGAMGNLDYESGGLNPQAVEGGKTVETGGIGLAQWTASRNKMLRAYANAQGKEWQDAELQIQFLIAELTPGGGADGYASYQLGSASSSKYDGNRYTIDDFLNTQDIGTATKAFCYIFERPDKDAANSSMSTRISRGQGYYDKYNGKTSEDFQGGSSEDFSKAEKVVSGEYVFPHYYQRNYAYRKFGSSNISTSGCGPTSMAMIVSGLTGNENVNPDSFVTALESYFPNYTSYYSPGQGSVYSGICNNGFLQKNYQLKSTVGEYSFEVVMSALEQGKCAIGRVPGHVLAIVPVPEEYKAQGYRFYVLDSGSGLDGPYKTLEAFNKVADQKRKNGGPLSFKAIISKM